MLFRSAGRFEGGHAAEHARVARFGTPGKEFLIRAILSARRTGVRAVEGAALEMLYTGNRIAGSNPALSASTGGAPFAA